MTSPNSLRQITLMMLKVREDIMEQSMVYEGYVKGEGVYQGEGRLLFKNGNSCALSYRISWQSLDILS